MTRLNNKTTNIREETIVLVADIFQSQNDNKPSWS